MNADDEVVKSIHDSIYNMYIPQLFLFLVVTSNWEI